MLIFYQLEKSTKRYKVSVYTGGKLGGGTDANVYIQIFGESAGHDSGLQPLRKDGRNLFERNKCDEFQIESYDLGAILLCTNQFCCHGCTSFVIVHPVLLVIYAILGNNDVSKVNKRT